MLLLAGCAAQRAEPVLYDHLGGERGVASIVDAFLYRLAENERLFESFADTDIERYRILLETQLCELSGGGCVYEGRSMKESHAGLGIDASLFNVMVTALLGAFNDADIEVGAQNRLLALLAPMYGDIVER